MPEEREIILKSTGAIGDVIIASALQKPLSGWEFRVGIASKGFTLPLWRGLGNVSLYDFENTTLQDLPTTRVADISNYLRHFPGTPGVFLPIGYMGEPKIGHLSEWMAYELHQETGIFVMSSRLDVRVALTEDEVAIGRDVIEELRRNYGNKPAVALTTTSSTKNKNLPEATLEEVVRGISGFSVPFIRSVDAKGSPIARVHYVNLDDEGLDIRTGGPALLLAADAQLTVDSAPLHMTMGAIQGTPDYGLGGVSYDPSKIVVALGSSHPDCVTYQGNRVLLATGDCVIAPCTAHGYWPVEKYGEHLKVKFTPTERDSSGCACRDYDKKETAPCMEAIPAEQIIEEIRSYLK